MRFYIYTVVLAVLAVALTAMAVVGVAWQWVLGTGILMLFVIVLCFRSVVRPLNTVRNGIYLLREQDFSSRLSHTGQPDADRVVDLFNGLMGAMKAERLKTLEQNRFLSQLIEASPMGIAVCDFDGNIVETNCAWDDMLTPEMEAAMATVPENESRIFRLDGSLIVRISRLWFMDSGFRRQFILAERLTNEIIAAEKQVYNKIVRTIGHEVNNTLGSVISVLDTLADMNSGDTDVCETIGSSIASCNNLVTFVRGYASLVKLPAPEPVTVDLNVWLSQIIPSLMGLAPANVTFDFIPDSRSRQAALDPMLMERVFVNIVMNAIESIGDSPDGRITIRVANRRITVTDNGSGITPEDAARLFTPFFSTKRPDRGLGLMLIADILRSHHARFSLAPAGQAGAVFTIELP